MGHTSLVLRMNLAGAQKKTAQTKLQRQDAQNPIDVDMEYGTPTPNGSLMDFDSDSETVLDEQALIEAVVRDETQSWLALHGSKLFALESSKFMANELKRESALKPVNRR